MKDKQCIGGSFLSNYLNKLNQKIVIKDICKICSNPVTVCIFNKTMKYKPVNIDANTIGSSLKYK